jgi:hypothetical protein
MDAAAILVARMKRRHLVEVDSGAQTENWKTDEQDLGYGTKRTKIRQVFNQDEHGSNITQSLKPRGWSLGVA